MEIESCTGRNQTKQRNLRSSGAGEGIFLSHWGCEVEQEKVEY